jgi:hypothetical protein
MLWTGLQHHVHACGRAVQQHGGFMIKTMCALTAAPTACSQVQDRPLCVKEGMVDTYSLNGLTADTTTAYRLLSSFLMLRVVCALTNDRLRPAEACGAAAAGSRLHEQTAKARRGGHQAR